MPFKKEFTLSIYLSIFENTMVKTTNNYLKRGKGR
jgi:hypothetical protein